VVALYSMDNIDKLKKSVQEFYPGVKSKKVKAVKRIIPQHHRADLGATTLIITTKIRGLRHNQIETGLDWEAFGKN